MNVIQHPGRLNGLRQIRAALLRRLESDLLLAITSMAKASEALSDVVRRTSDEQAKRQLTAHKYVFAEFQNIMSAPLPALSDLPALRQRFVALSDMLETLTLTFAPTPDAIGRGPAELSVDRHPT
ncbi:MAG TPA: hypothetical protein VMH36_01280 [Alphaproteobacteria bacterium]|nr:hypothetical protein [Alphaproteobacteria bacterium]